MKIAYLDCLSGISGDMTLGALVDCGIELAAIQAGIDSLGFPNIRLTSEEVKRHGFRATKVKVKVFEWIVMMVLPHCPIGAMNKDEPEQNIPSPHRSGI